MGSCTAASAAVRAAGLAGVVVVTDMFGGSPSNLSLLACTAGSERRIIYGANLPMLMRACCYRELSLAQRAQKALDGGQQGIIKIEP